MNHGTDLHIEEEELLSRRGEAAAFRVRVDERLKKLEAQVEELTVRINGLLFFLAGTVIAQILLGFFP
jgi:hypothetical protein